MSVRTIRIKNLFFTIRTLSFAAVLATSASVGGCHRGAVGVAQTPPGPTQPGAGSTGGTTGNSPGGTTGNSPGGATALDPTKEVIAPLVFSPTFGQVFAKGASTSLHLTGAALQAGATVTVLALDPADQDAKAAQSTWKTIGSAVASSTPRTDGGATSFYDWQLDVTSLSPSSSAWPRGGLARLKVLVNGSSALPFEKDLTRCKSDNVGASLGKLAARCGSSYASDLVLLQSDGFPTRPYRFLVRTANESQYVGESGLYFTKAHVEPERRNLDAWMRTNGFPGTNDIAVKYYNAWDLGYGRDMHCRKLTDGSNGVACYVINYGDPYSPHSLSLQQAVSDERRIATVAMEWRPNIPDNPITYVAFNGNNGLINAVNLDVQIGKYSPFLCLSCHGGTYDFTTHTVQGSSFLPFMTQAFDYPSDPAFSMQAQQDKFRQLNELVKLTNPAPSITTLIDGMYPAGVSTPGALADAAYVPVGWKGHEALYNNVARPYCRNCHVSRAGPVTFDTYAGFAAYEAKIREMVCQTSLMPDAELTHFTFWNSAARAFLAAEFNWSVCNP